MIRKTILLLAIVICSISESRSQAFVRTIDLIRMNKPASTTGELNISQNQAIDTLISRYIISRGRIRTLEGTPGVEGFRIQIYSSSVRTAREESAKARAKFISIFGDIASYPQYQEPGYFMVRVGDYRTKTEAYKYLLMVRKEFPNAILVPTPINFPDLIKN